MKKIILLLFALSLILGCRGEKSGEGKKGLAYRKPIAGVDLNEIRERGKLIALTGYSATSYFIYKGEPMGYEYELLDLLARYLGVEMEIKIARDLDNIFNLLNGGAGDIIAHNLTITKERSKRVTFTEHHNFIRQVLVQRKPENWRKKA